MKCDDFLPAMETGGLMRRWAARRHARQCPQCAAAWQILGNVKDELAAPAADLPPHLRRRWVAVARELASPVSGAPTPWAGNLRLFKPAAALVAVLLLALIPALIYRSFRRGQAPQAVGPTTHSSVVVGQDQRSIGPITVTQVDRAAELARMDTEIVQLQTRIRAVIESAERLEARQRITLVLAQNTNWLDRLQSNP